MSPWSISDCLVSNLSPDPDLHKLTFHRGINEGRQSAREVDLYLEGSSSLPVTGGIVKRTAEEILGGDKKHAEHAAAAPVAVAA